MRCAVVKIPGFDEILDILNRERDQPLTAFDLATLNMKPVTKINNFWDGELEKSMDPESHIEYDESMWKRIKWSAIRLWSFDEHTYGGLIHLPMFNSTFTRMVKFTCEVNPDDVILPFDLPLVDFLCDGRTGLLHKNQSHFPRRPISRTSRRTIRGRVCQGIY